LFYRNYLVNGTGQDTPDNQIDGLKEAHKYLLKLYRKSNPSVVKDKLWNMVNGYCIPVDNECLRIINDLLATVKPIQRNEFKKRITYAVQWKTQVTGMREKVDRDENKFTGSNLEDLHTVAQIYCSSVPMPGSTQGGYNSHLSTDQQNWKPFITAIQEAIFEITYTAAIQLWQKNGSKGRQNVFLTDVGCGVFRNPKSWSDAAIDATNIKFKDYPLDVYLVNFSHSAYFDISKAIQVPVIATLYSKGGKSGSKITRKRRLRLKKSRNITRHKGGKKSVRFSARVKLNNGNGNGNGKGKGSLSMNKKTRKVSSSSYKLSARRVIKLKR